MIEKSWRPLILIGAGANRKRTAKTLTALVEKTGIPFFNTQMGKGVVDENHTQYLGCAALSSNDYVHCAIDKADLIINFGHDIIEKPPFLMKKGGPRVIHVNFAGAEVHDIYAPDLEVVGDVANTAWQLSERIQPQKQWDFTPFFKVKEVFDAEVSNDEKDERFPLVPQRIVREVRDALPQNSIISLDNGMYKIWFSRNLRVHEPNTLLLDNALATMGAGLPSAIAAKLLYPDVPVVAVVGDGGFMMTVAELETAKRLGLDLTVIVLNDNGFGMIKWKQEMEKFADFGLSFGNPNFMELAESFGARGHKVTRPGELASFLKLAQENKGFHVIEVPIDYSENDRVLNRGLRENICP